MGVSVTVFAQDTVLQAEVPDAHTVTVKSDDGRVALDGVVCKETVDVERHREQKYRIIPNDGKVIDKVLYNGEDVTKKLVKGVFSAPTLVRDAELTVICKDAPPAPDDRKYDIRGTAEDENGKILPDVTVEIGGQTAETDEDGNFEIKDLPSGIHSIVIIDKDGTIIGSTQLTIEKAEGNELTITTDADGYPVVRPGKDTRKISLTLVSQKDGDVGIKEATDITPALPVNTGGTGNPGNSGKPGSSGNSGVSGNPKIPQTGDFSHINLWISLTAVSAGVIFIVLFGNRRKKKAAE